MLHGQACADFEERLDLTDRRVHPGWPAWLGQRSPDIRPHDQSKASVGLHVRAHDMQARACVSTVRLHSSRSSDSGSGPHVAHSSMAHPGAPPQHWMCSPCLRTGVHDVSGLHTLKGEGKNGLPGDEIRAGSVVRDVGCPEDPLSPPRRGEKRRCRGGRRGWLGAWERFRAFDPHPSPLPARERE